MTESPRPCSRPNDGDTSAPLFRDRRSRCTCRSGPAVGRPDHSRGGGRPVRAAGRERDRLREHAAGDPSSDWQHHRLRVADDPGVRDRDQRRTPGETVTFKIKTPSTAYHIDILRLGYYQGNGARKVAARHDADSDAAAEPAGVPDRLAPTGLIDCGNWGVSASWTVPPTPVSGVYIAHLVRDDTGGGSQILFVVRNDSSHSDICSRRPTRPGRPTTPTAATACTVRVELPARQSGRVQGRLQGLLQPAVRHRRRRPAAATGCFYAEYPDDPLPRGERLRRQLHRRASTSTAPAGRCCSTTRCSCPPATTSTGRARSAPTSRRPANAGVNLAFFSGNEVFWKTRWEPSADGTNTPYRTLVTYKETH